MGEVQAGRWTHVADTDVVVFVLGMRINRPWRVDQWLPVFRAMPRMLAELARQPERGLLGVHNTLLAGGPAVLQYWRSLEDLHAYASDPAAQHRPAWTDFNRRARAARGAVGIWHETYVVPAAQQESVYADMPAVGLARAVGAVPVARRGERARQRMGMGS